MSRDEREWTFRAGSWGVSGGRGVWGHSGRLFGPQLERAKVGTTFTGWCEIELVPKTALEAAEAERDEARKWAASSENPAFDAGWSAGKRRADQEMRWRAEQAEAEADRLRGTLQFIGSSPWTEHLSDHPSAEYARAALRATR